MAAQYHPPGEMLIDYASGALREAPSLIIATHLALCWECRVTVNRCEAVGGTLLNRPDAESVAVSSKCRDAVMAALDAQQTPGKPEPAGYDPFFCNVLPAPLRNYVGCNVSDVPWKKISATADQINLDSCSCSAGKARLLRVKAGATLPQPGNGTEYTLVLSGFYRDQGRLVRRGDFDMNEGSSTRRRLVEGTEDCVYLIVTAGSSSVTGWLKQLLKKLTRS